MRIGKLVGSQDQFDSPLAALLADEGMEEPGALCRNAKIRAEYANGLVYIDLRTMALRAVDGDPLTGLLEVSEGPIDGRMGHEKRGWKLRKTPDLLGFPVLL